MSIEATQIIVKNPPVTDPNFEWNQPTSTFEIIKKTINPETDLKDGEVFVKTLYLSNDPYTRSIIQKVEGQTYPQGYPVGAAGLGEILQSKSTKYKKGDLITGIWSWTDYATVHESVIYFPIDKASKYPLTYYLSLLGVASLTAYFGLIKIFNFSDKTDNEAFKKKNLIIISAASGTVGSVAVQLCKHLFGITTVVGITGTDNKVKWVESIGADKAFNYNTPTFESDLHSYVSGNGGADYYFDNVGGEVLNFVLTQMNPFGKIAACGSISKYNDPKNSFIPNWSTITVNRLQVLGFTVHDYIPEYPQGVAVLEKAIADGKLATENSFSIEDISEEINKFDLIPLIWNKVFQADKANGKIVTKLVN